MDLEYPDDEPLKELSFAAETVVSTSEWSKVGVGNPIISLCAVSGLQGTQTIHVVWYSCKRPLQVFLDGGNTHNFIDIKAAK